MPIESPRSPSDHSTQQSHPDTERLPIQIIAKPGSDCALVSVEGLATASESVLEATVREVHDTLQRLRTAGYQTSDGSRHKVTLAFAKPGSAALPVMLLSHVPDFMDTTVLVVDGENEPSLAFVSNDFVTVRTQYWGEPLPPGVRPMVSSFACVGLTHIPDTEEWMLCPGVLHRYEDQDPSEAFLIQQARHCKGLFPDSPDASVRQSRQATFDRALEQCREGQWDEGHNTWNKYIRELFPESPQSAPWGLLSDYVLTGETRRLWREFLFAHDDIRGEVVWFEPEIQGPDDGEFGDETPSGAGWPWR